MGDTGRGGEWVAAQFPLVASALLAPHLGPRWPGALVWLGQVAGAGLLLGGAYLFGKGLLDLGENLTPFPKPKDDARLVREGVYGIVRHPIYAGGVLATTGWALATANTTRLLLAGAVYVFFNAKAGREEVWLLARYPDYAAYRTETPKLLPGLR